MMSVADEYWNGWEWDWGGNSVVVRRLGQVSRDLG